VRKTVTVLFCDVVGSTELGERLDPEVLRGVMARFYATVREPVERHGGTVEKLIGDALVAVFGIPVVREDDALRAVRAALEIRDAVRALDDVEARVGVNTGDVFAGDAMVGEPLVVGDAVNMAARLEQAAPAGTVLVGEATWSLVAHAARGQLVAPVVAKGKSEPLVAWRLDGVDPRAGGHRRRLDLPMVARESELALLRVVVQRTAQLQRPHLVTVLGQPGIGKSRLVAELPRLGSDLTVLTGQCRATATASSLEPLLEAARGAIPATQTTAEGVAALMPGDPEAPSVAACLSPAGAGRASDVAWGLSHLIAAMALVRPVVIVLEDVHWADAALLDVVEQLVGRARSRSLLVVCTARPEFAEGRPQWGTGANAMSIALERLDDAQTRRLLASASPDLPADRAERVIATAEGNPLFAEHLAALVEDNDPTGGLPRSIQVLLSARLEALPASEREVMSVASVAGRDFPVAAVEALIGRPVTADIERVVQRELLEPTAAGRQQFAHALLQEAAYGLIPKQRRSELHTRLARWLDEDGAGDAAVGGHLERSVGLRTELGLADDVTAKLREEAGARLAAAGRRADAMGDPLGAQQLLERALLLLPERSPGHAEALVELAAAAWNVLPSDQTQSMLAVAADLAGDLGLRALELRARLLRLVGTLEGEPSAVLDDAFTADLGAAIRELEQLDDPRALATGLTAQAENDCSLGRAADAVAAARRALDLVLTAEEDTVWALATLIWAVRESPMPVPEIDALLGGLMDELGMRPTVRSELIQGQAMVGLLAGRTADAWRLLESAGEIERDLGRIQSVRLADTRGAMLLRAGRFGEARDFLGPMLRELERRELTWEVPVAQSRLGLAEARLGNLTDARVLALSALEFAPYAGGHEAHVRALQVLSEVHLAEGEAGAALERGREAVAVAGAGDWVLLHGDARLTLARALSLAGDSAAAAEARAAMRLYEGKGYTAGTAAAAELVRSLG
jgi:class 3 adenylate cyclase/tetratricopeptide (TPR) repeat protein